MTGHTHLNFSCLSVPLLVACILSHTLTHAHSETSHRLFTLSAINVCHLSHFLFCFLLFKSFLMFFFPCFLTAFFPFLLFFFFVSLRLTVCDTDSCLCCVLSECTGYRKIKTEPVCLSHGSPKTIFLLLFPRTCDSLFCFGFLMSWFSWTLRH